MPKLFTAKEDKNGDFVTVNHVRYTVRSIDPARIHIPAGREGDIVFHDTQDEFLAAMGLSPSEGHTFPEPEPEPVSVPSEADLWKIKTVLQLLDKWDNVIAVAGTLPDDQKIPILNGLQHASALTRVHPLVQLMIAIPELNITSEQMDDIFVSTRQYD